MPRYDRRSALLVVDVQNDFADPAGSLYVTVGDRILTAVNESVATATDAGALVVYSRDWHPEITPHFEKDGGIWPVHCVHDTWGAAFHPDLRVNDDPSVIRKGSGGRMATRRSAFAIPEAARHGKRPWGRCSAIA